jgi:hypothetical protein
MAPILVTWTGRSTRDESARKLKKWKLSCQALEEPGLGKAERSVSDMRQGRETSLHGQDGKQGGFKVKTREVGEGCGTSLSLDGASIAYTIRQP